MPLIFAPRKVELNNIAPSRLASFRVATAIVTRLKSTHALWHQSGLLAASPQSAPPEPADAVAETAEGASVEGQSVVVEVPAQDAASHFPHFGTDACSRRLSSILIRPSFRRTRFRDVSRSTVNRPFRVFPHTCVKPRKSEIEALRFPRPFRTRFPAAPRPN